MSKDQRLNPKEAAEFLGVHEKTLGRWLRAGIGPGHIRIGKGRGRIYYERGELERYRREGEKRRVTNELPAIPPLVEELPAIPPLVEEPASSLP